MSNDDNYHEVHAPLVSDALSSIASSLDSENATTRVLGEVADSLATPDERGEEVSIAGGLFAIAKALDRIADIMEART